MQEYRESIGMVYGILAGAGLTNLASFLGAALTIREKGTTNSYNGLFAQVVINPGVYLARKIFEK